MTSETTEGQSPEMDQTIIALNTAIGAAVTKYLADWHIDVVFDIPSAEQTPEAPTVSIFLFDIQEDLELRSGRSRTFNEATGELSPSYVNVVCRYLLTYWSANQGGPSRLTAEPDSQAAKVINAVLNALLNLRYFESVPVSNTRVIPPLDLQSLGTFWQALGNKPRLCLGYTCTVPVRLYGFDRTGVKIERPYLELNSKN